MKDVRVMGRSTQGVRLVNLHEGDYLVGLQKIEHLESDRNSLQQSLQSRKNETPVEPQKL